MSASNMLLSNAEMLARGALDGSPYLSRSRFPSLAASEARSLLVRTEQEWRKRPCEPEVGLVNAPSTTLARWTVPKHEKAIEVYCDTTDSAHVVTLSISNVVGEIYFNGSQVPFRVPQARGAIIIDGPISRPCRGIYHSAADVFRVYVPQSLLQECFECVYGHRPQGDIALVDITESADRTVKDLAGSLLSADALAPSLGPAYVDGIGLALAARLLALHGPSPRAPGSARRPALSPCRLRRVYEYVEENLQHAIRLVDLSKVAELSRMHFAAQFRVATGFSPHKFILQRRIDRAQQLLRDPQMSIVDVALTVGFANQAHFSEVFKKSVGSPPNRWRKMVLER